MCEPKFVGKKCRNNRALKLVKWELPFQWLHWFWGLDCLFPLLYTHGQVIEFYFFKSLYFVFKDNFRDCFDNTTMTFYCIVNLNAPLMGDGLYAFMHSLILKTKKKCMYVSQETSHRLQKNVLLNRKLGNGQETKGTIMEIFQAWIRLLTNENPAGNSDKGAGCLLKNYSCKLPDWLCCWQDP